MREIAWVRLNSRERALLLNALKMIRRSISDDRKYVDALKTKLANSVTHPNITVGVHGGQVQWAWGNPFPIRICDYDAPSDEELPDIDERGQPCRIWWEPADESTA